MNRVTRTASLLGATVLALSLTACGDESGSGGSASGGDNYCDELESASEELTNLGQDAMSNPDSLSSMADTFQNIADSAPDEIKSDWNAVADALGQLSEIDLTDPEAMQDPKVQEQLQGMQDMQANADKIEQHAKEECDIDLGGSGATE